MCNCVSSGELYEGVDECFLLFRGELYLSVSILVLAVVVDHLIASSCRGLKAMLQACDATAYAA